MSDFNLRRWGTAAALLGLGLLWPVSAEESKGEKVALDQVPAVVLEAATKAQEGFKATEVEKEMVEGAVVYEVEGKAGDKTYEIKVAADGKVISATEEKAEDKGEHAGHEHKKEEKKAE